MIPVDFKEPSEKAVHYAGKMAERLNSQLILLYVIDTPGILAQFFSSGDQLVKVTDEAKEKLFKLAKSIKTGMI